jgi:calcineurin-like phosphoesterase family protein
MSTNIFFISDLHLGHKNLLAWSGDVRKGESIEEHDAWLEDNWRSVVRGNSVVWVLGDVAWKREALLRMKNWPGSKHLIMGNHDGYSLDVYREVFNVIRPGLWAYKSMWLSHAPIHELELRGRVNVHGHVHKQSIPDPRYYNACVESVGGIPRRLDEVLDTFSSRGIKVGL